MRTTFGAQIHVRSELAALLPLLARGSADGFIHVNNHYAGHGPATARELKARVESKR